jgi:hypothetical protein
MHFEVECFLLEKSVGLKIETAHGKLKDFLLKNKCAIIAEEAPTHIVVKQGSLWGISPRTAKKKISYRLISQDSGTQISSSSSWTMDYKNLTIIGIVSSVFLAILCLWISADLQAYIVTLKHTYWSWLANAQGMIDLQRAQLLINLTRTLAAFLTLTLTLEVIVIVYAHHRIDMFAEESLRIFP